MGEKKPRIGLCPLYNEEKARYVLPAAYMDALIRAGALPLILPLSQAPALLDPLLCLCDAFLFPGGPDLDPALYGEEKSPLSGPPLPVLDEMERYLTLGARRLNKPLLGICRGAQAMNAVLGGSLYQDLPSQFGQKVQHQMPPPYDRPAHPVLAEPDSPLLQLWGKAEISVNSLHHQGIKTLAPGLQVMARSPDGLVEAFCLAEADFFWGLQWHPELTETGCVYSRAVFSAFVQAARR